MSKICTETYKDYSMVDSADTKIYITGDNVAFEFEHDRIVIHHEDIIRAFIEVAKMKAGGNSMRYGDTIINYIIQMEGNA